MSALARQPFRLTGWHVLIGMVSFFVIIIGLDIWFAVLAYRSFSGEVASNPYEAGIAYNRALEARQRQAALGWRMEIETDRPGLIGLVWRDQAGTPLDGLTIAASLTRPATEKGRQVLVFQSDGEGRYVADAPAMAGAWDLEATATDQAGERFETRYRIFDQ